MTSARPWPGTAARPAHTVEQSADINALAVCLLFGFHALLGLLMNRISHVATAHALATVGIGLVWALTKRDPKWVIAVAAYITGGEVLWRMCEARIFWEFGKYATVAVLGAALVLRPAGFNARGVAYLALLFPSVLITLTNPGVEDPRGELSFNLSGPLALGVSVCFCSTAKLTRKDLMWVLVWLAAPITSIAAISLFSTVTAEGIYFANEGNMTTSGGYGPNQVSAALGLGAFACAFLLMSERRKPMTSLLLLGALVMFALQSALTFSRGGLYAAAGAIIVAATQLVRDARMRRLMIQTVVLLGIAAYAVVPAIDAFTGGALGARFRNTNTTNRSELMEGDLELWLENPIAGVGPGMALYTRRSDNAPMKAAHTEFTRLLAEHGTFGLAAMIVLFSIPITAWFSTRDPYKRALVGACTFWAFLFMAVNAMRLVAPSFIFALATVSLVSSPVVQAAARSASNRASQLTYSRRLGYQRLG